MSHATPLCSEAGSLYAFLQLLLMSFNDRFETVSESSEKADLYAFSPFHNLYHNQSLKIESVQWLLIQSRYRQKSAVQYKLIATSSELNDRLRRC